MESEADMGKASRDKGKRGERAAANLLSAAGFPAARAQQFKGRAGAFDVDCPALAALGLEVEVKNTERAALPAWLDKAHADAAPGNEPLILWHRRGGAWYAILPATKLLELLPAAK